jgi:hypothetical protein
MRQRARAGMRDARYMAPSAGAGGPRARRGRTRARESEDAARAGREASRRKVRRANEYLAMSVETRVRSFGRSFV